MRTTKSGNTHTIQIDYILHTFDASLCIFCALDNVSNPRPVLWRTNLYCHYTGMGEGYQYFILLIIILPTVSHRVIQYM